MKATMLALVERSTGVLHAANTYPRIGHVGAITGVFATRAPFALFAA